MDGAGDEFLAGAALTVDQDAGGSVLLHQADVFEDGLNGGAVAAEAFQAPALGFALGEHGELALEGFALGDFFFEGVVFVYQLLVFGGQLLGQRV